MYATTKNHWLTNLAAICVIIFSLTGSALFVTALLHPYQPALPGKVLLPAPPEGISAEPLLPMQVDPMASDPLLSDPISADPEEAEPMRPSRIGVEPMPETRERFERARIMASYKAMHSIL
ncbi:MAG TPA: hypothetical protein VN084_04345 [Methylophilaceae bacterium]|nr:hypothetical protein [Methylophilaceae bacterium]